MQTQSLMMLPLTNEWSMQYTIGRVRGITDTSWRSRFQIKQLLVNNWPIDLCNWCVLLKREPCRITRNRIYPQHILRRWCSSPRPCAGQPIRSCFTSGFRTWALKSAHRIARSWRWNPTGKNHWTAAHTWNICIKWCNWFLKRSYWMQEVRALRRRRRLIPPKPNDYALKSWQLDTAATRETWKWSAKRIRNSLAIRFFTQSETTACFTNRTTLMSLCITMKKRSRMWDNDTMNTPVNVNPCYCEWGHPRVKQPQLMPIWNWRFCRLMISSRSNFRLASCSCKIKTCCILWITAALRAHSLEIAANGQKTLKRLWMMQLSGFQIKKNCWILLRLHIQKSMHCTIPTATSI